MPACSYPGRAGLRVTVWMVAGGAARGLVGVALLGTPEYCALSVASLFGSTLSSSFRQELAAACEGGRCREEREGVGGVS